MFQPRNVFVMLHIMSINSPILDVFEVVDLPRYDLSGFWWNMRLECTAQDRDITQIYPSPVHDEQPVGEGRFILQFVREMKAVFSAHPEELVIA